MAGDTWIVLTSWVRFLGTMRENSTHLSERAIKRGVYQVLALEVGFIAPVARAEIDALIEEFYVPLEQALEEVQ